MSLIDHSGAQSNGALDPLRKTPHQQAFAHQVQTRADLGRRRKGSARKPRAVCSNHSDRIAGAGSPSTTSMPQEHHGCRWRSDYRPV